MTLTTHAITGAAVATLFPQHPIFAFCAAFASHFVLDAIPHYDYPVRSGFVHPNIASGFKFDRALMTDIASIGSDGALGILLPLVCFLPLGSAWLILLGAIAGMLPDALQFVYAHFKHEPLISLQRFHHWAHTKYRMRGQMIWGVASQILFVSLVVVARYLLF